MKIYVPDVGIPGFTMWRNYIPPRYNYARPVVAIVTGLLCVVFYTVVSIRSYMRRDTNSAAESKKVGRSGRIFERCLQFMLMLNTTPQAFLVNLAANLLMLLFTVAITIYCWSIDLNRRGKRYPIRWNDKRGLGWDTTQEFDPFNWNCALYPIVADTPRRYHNMCNEGMWAPLHGGQMFTIVTLTYLRSRRGPRYDPRTTRLTGRTCEFVRLEQTSNSDCCRGQHAGQRRRVRRLPHG